GLLMTFHLPITDLSRDGHKHSQAHPGNRHALSNPIEAERPSDATTNSVYKNRIYTLPIIQPSVVLKAMIFPSTKANSNNLFQERLLRLTQQLLTIRNFHLMLQFKPIHMVEIFANQEDTVKIHPVAPARRTGKNNQT
ncbi:MAG: hypothetical protein P8Y03_01975, partial [Anaerolineales bacterium]